MWVHSTKYDGSLHYRYEIAPVAEMPGERRVYLAPGTPLESYRGGWPSRYPMLMLYWSDRPYNLHLSWFTDWRVRQYYVNIALPASWDEEVVRFVDLDLDIIWKPELGPPLVDDEDEFEAHRSRFGYPEALVRQAREAVVEVMGLMEARAWPFDGSLEGWRP